MSEYYIEKENLSMANDGIEFFCQNFLKSGRVNPHIHSAVEILLVVKGVFRVQVDDAEDLVPEGGAVMFRSNAIHRVWALQADSYYYVLKLKPSLILSLCSKEYGHRYLLSLATRNKNSKLVWTKEECENNGISKLLAKLLYELESREYGFDMAIKAYSAELLLKLLRDTESEKSQKSAYENSRTVRQIYDAVAFINKHYADDITAKQCSEAVFLSYTYFSQSFKNIVGMTFKDYLILTRINHAEKELLSTERSVAEIACCCGFNNVSHFIALFKRLKGTTPLALRKLNEKI